MLWRCLLLPKKLACAIICSCIRDTAQDRDHIPQSSSVCLILQINAGKIPAFLTGDREVLDALMNNSEMTPAMASTIRVLNLLTSSAGFDASKVCKRTIRLARLRSTFRVFRRVAWYAQ